MISRGRLNRVIGAVEAVGRLFHRGDAGDDFFARTIGDVEEDFRGVGDALDRRDHLIDRSGSFRNARGLNLRVLHDVLHVDAHLVHRAGDFFDCGGSLDADLCGFVGRACDLIRTGGNLSGGIARRANEILQAVLHADESVAERVALRTRNDFDGEVAFGNGLETPAISFR